MINVAPIYLYCMMEVEKSSLTLADKFPFHDKSLLEQARLDLVACTSLASPSISGR